MAKILAIIGCTFAFALIGLAVAYIAVQNLPDRSPQGKDADMVVAVSVLPPLFGSVFGLVVGCVATFVGKKTGP